MTSKPRAAIYARLSAAQTGKADDEKSDSITNQVADLEALAKTHGYEILDTYTDDGVSGYSGKYRPQFQRLLSDIADRRLDIVLARHADRLERNEEEGTILRVASIRAGIRWQYASGQVVDPAAAEGGLIARVLSAISEFESQVKSERLRQHYQGRRLAGLLPAQKDCMGYAGFEVVEHEAERVREAFDMFTAEGSIRAIVTKWNAEGVPLKRGGAQGWSNAHVVGILRRPRYAGLVADRDGSIIEGLTGQWEPLVPVDQWMAVQAKLNNPERKTNAKGRTPLSLSAGLAQCAVCGFPMRTSTGKAWKTGEKYSILLCRNPKRGGVRHPSGNVADLDALIRDAVVNAFAFGPSKLFDDDHDSAAVHDVYGKLADLREKRQKVVKLYEDGALEEFEVKERLAAYGQSIATLQDRLEALTSASAAAGMLVDLRAGFVDPETHRASFEGLAILRAALAEKFDALDILQRRRLVKALLRVEVSNGQGTQSYLILHRVVRSLNDDAENEYLDSLS